VTSRRKPPLHALSLLSMASFEPSRSLCLCEVAGRCGPRGGTATPPQNMSLIVMQIHGHELAASGSCPAAILVVVPAPLPESSVFIARW